MKRVSEIHKILAGLPGTSGYLDPGDGGHTWEDSLRAFSFRMK